MIKSKILIAATLFLSLTVIPAFATSQSNIATTSEITVKTDQNNIQSDEFFVEQAVNKIKAKNYQGAITDCNKAIELNPSYAEAYSKRGEAKMLLNNYQGNIASLNRAISNPNLAITYNNKGFAKTELKDYQGAIIDLDKAIKLDPTDARAYNNKA